MDHDNRPQLILLNGAPGIGKTSLGERYIRDHPLALCIEGDQLITMIGHWNEHEPVSRALVFEYMKGIVAAHLAAGYDVLLPYVLLNADHVTSYEQIAEAHGAVFIEVLLHTAKTDAVARLMKRGTWGEAGLPPLTEKDLPEIEALFDTMAEELKKRPYTIRVDSVEGAAEETYQKLLAAIATVRGRDYSA